jgi:N-sulfoglucosamine sulfohydrolase
MNNFKIDQRRFFKTVTALGFAMIAVPSLMAAEAQQARPNILFCLADDWAWPHALAYGDKVIKTPAFDRLVKEGVLFQYAFVSSPSCTPSRNALLTGQQFYRLEEGANLRSTLDVRYPNFMYLLRDAGYEIAHVSKAWGPGSSKVGGYTEDPCGPQKTFDAFIKQRNKAKPFCYWFGTTDPHRPYEKGRGAKSGIKEIDKIHVPKFLPDEDTVRSDIADYYFGVQRWDTEVGNVLKLLEQEGQLDNTIIVMSGDNGIPFPRCKTNIYDWGVRAPLAIRWGNTVKAGRVVTDFVSFTDLAPTFLDAASVKIPEEMTGHSLLPVLRSGDSGRIDPEHDFAVFGRERHTPAQENPSTKGYPMRGIRTDKWLLIMNLEPDRWPAGVPEGATLSNGKGSYADCDRGPTKKLVESMQGDPKNGRFYDLCFAKRGPLELYDCEKDPDQINNLANVPEYAGTVAELKARLVKYLEKTADPRFTGKPVKFEEYPYR